MAGYRKNYRKIYENFHGPIPVDSDGRTYDVHHIDGNRDNNTSSNLVALPIQEHYNIHWSQGDYGACYYIALRMNKTPQELSELAKFATSEHWKTHTHHAKGTGWYNNGKEQGMFKEAPKGWVRGRLSFNNVGAKAGGKAQRNKKWYNNGLQEGMYKQAPEGWVPGRIEAIKAKKGLSKPEWSQASKRGWDTRRSNKVL